MRQWFIKNINQRTFAKERQCSPSGELSDAMTIKQLLALFRNPLLSGLPSAGNYRAGKDELKNGMKPDENN